MNHQKVPVYIFSDTTPEAVQWLSKQNQILSAGLSSFSVRFHVPHLPAVFPPSRNGDCGSWRFMLFLTIAISVFA